MEPQSLKVKPVAESNEKNVFFKESVQSCEKQIKPLLLSEELRG